MTDTQDKPKPPDDARFDDLLTTIRSALAQDAASDTRNAGAVACRAILGALDPTSRSTWSPPPTSTTTTASATSSPIAAALGALGQIPREQVLQYVVGGLRSMLSQSGPSYFSAPPRVVERAAAGEPPATSMRPTSRPNGKRSDGR